MSSPSTERVVYPCRGRTRCTRRSCGYGCSPSTPPCRSHTIRPSRRLLGPSSRLPGRGGAEKNATHRRVGRREGHMFRSPRYKGGGAVCSCPRASRGSFLFVLPALCAVVRSSPEGGAS